MRLPAVFVVRQDAMIQECARAGCLKRKNIANLAVMDGSRLNKVGGEGAGDGSFWELCSPGIEDELRRGA